MGLNAEKVFVGIDPNNPAHVWACCGLAELCGRIEPESLFRFELARGDSRFVTSGPADEALRRLLSEETGVERVRKKNGGKRMRKRKATPSGENEDESKDDPVILRIPGLEPMRLNWWLTDGELDTIPQLKLWAGPREGSVIFGHLLRACRSQAARDENWLRWSGNEPCLGVDPSAAWTTLSVGHSEVPHRNKPGIELLASIGLLWSRLALSYRDRRGDSEKWHGAYTLWTNPLPLPSARLAMVGLLAGDGKRYRHGIEWRGSNKNWLYAVEE